MTPNNGNYKEASSTAKHRYFGPYTSFKEINAILDGVEEGLGRAVMAKHLISSKKNIRIVGGFKKVEKEIVLHYFKRPYYPKIYKEISKILKAGL